MGRKRSAAREGVEREAELDSKVLEGLVRKVKAEVDREGLSFEEAQGRLLTVVLEAMKQAGCGESGIAEALRGVEEGDVSQGEEDEAES
jgi:hypothetical protein